MLTCIARPKKPGDDSLSHPNDSDPNNNHAIKSLTSQIKEMALKASGSYKHYGTYTGPSRLGAGKGESSEAESERFRWSYKSSSGRTWGKEMEARLKGISSGEGTPPSSLGCGSGRRVVLLVEEDEPAEWVAQVEPGVLITFVSLPRGGNHLKRIRFSIIIDNQQIPAQCWSRLDPIWIWLVSPSDDDNGSSLFFSFFYCGLSFHPSS